MLGYQTIYDKSMNGIKVVSDGQATISDGNLSATNVVAVKLYGVIMTNNQPSITYLGTLTSLSVSGDSTFKNIWSDSIIQSNGSSLTQSGLGRINQSAVTFGNLNIMAGISLNPNSPIYFSGSGSLDQTGTTGTNNLSTIAMINNANITQNGSGIIIQFGSSTNSLKATKITGQFTIIGNMVQTSGSNTFYDSSFTNINQLGNSTFTQAIGGTGTNAFNKTTITDLTVTNAMTIPSGITMPSATFNGDSSYIGTAKIIQSGSTGINDFNGSTFNGNIYTNGNFNMTGGSTTSSLKTPTILGLTTLEGIVQSSGTAAFRSITTNQIDINSNFNLYNSGTGIISQLGTGTNLFKSSNFSGLVGFAGNINQTSGTNTFLDSIFGNLTLSSAKVLKFSNDIARKITLYDSTGTNAYNYYGVAVEGGVIRYNTEGAGTSHVFSYGNTTVFVETMRVNNTGLGIGTTPSYKLHVLGSTKLDGINLFTTSLNGITPATFSYLDATSSIQTQLNAASSTGSGNSTAITTLQNKTTDLTYASFLSTFANAVLIGGALNVSGLTTFTQLPTCSVAPSTGYQLVNKNYVDSYYAPLSSPTITGLATLPNVTMSSGSQLKFVNYFGRQIILTDAASSTVYNHYGFGVENTGGVMIRYNVDFGQSHVFSTANAYPGTGFLELFRANSTGLGIGTLPSYKLHVLGTTKLDGINLFTTSLNGITPTTFAFLNNVSSDIQNQLNTLSGLNSTNTTNINTLFVKTTNQTYASGTTTFSGTLSTATINNSGAISSTSCNISNDFFCSGSGVFPSSNTGGNQGLALYWNKSGAGGEVDYLARGQGGFGGHRFYRSNNTTTPTLMLDMTSTVSTFYNDVTVNGKLNIAGVSTLNEITATSLITYDDPTPTYVTTYNNTGLAATFTVGAYYGKQITISTPISFKQNGSVAPPNSSSFTGTFTSATCTVLKSGVAFSTPVVISTNGFAIVKTYTGSPNTFNVEQYFTNLMVSFQPTVQATSAVYTISFTINGNVTNLNTTVSTVSSSNVNVFSPSGVGYVAANYTEFMYNIGGRTGHTEFRDANVTNNLLVGANVNANSVTTTSMNCDSIIANTSTILNGTTLINSTLNALGVSNLSSLNFNGMPGAYIVDGNLSGISYPINSSITNYNDFYSKSTTSSVYISVGSIVTATFNLNDKDDMYMVMPGYQLQVFDTIGYSGAVTLNANNTSKYPIWCAPTSINTGSSCKLYYNGIELI